MLHRYKDSPYDEIEETKSPYSYDAHKQLIFISLVELCILRCIRPDKIVPSIKNFVKNVMNDNR